MGAEILERVAFPYPVAPIVRSHHERWDGTGYPEGLSGEQIPIGARILAAVDCLDALASHRQYRPALPLVEAMAKVKEKAGTWFDPQVVEILQSRYVELERMAQMSEDTRRPADSRRSCAWSAVSRRQPDSNAPNPRTAPADSADFLTSIASARQEAQTMFELSQDLGVSLSLSETLSVLSMRLRRMIPYDSIAVFVNRNGWLLPELVSGENFRMLSSLKIKVGEGLCGWVAANCKPIVNGNPQVEAGYVVDPGKAHDAAIGAGCASRRSERSGWRAGHVSRQSRCLYPRSFENPAGGSLESRSVGRERIEVSASREFGNHRLSDRPAQRAVAVCASGAGSGALPPHENFAGGAGVRYRRLQGRSTIPSGTWKATNCCANLPRG